MLNSPLTAPCQPDSGGCRIEMFEHAGEVPSVTVTWAEDTGGDPLLFAPSVPTATPATTRLLAELAQLGVVVERMIDSGYWCG